MFIFENLSIWKKSIEITDKLLDLSDYLEDKHQFKFAEQLRGSTLSISNNIAEGSGSNSKREFKLFLNYSHRSVSETANMVIISARRNYIEEKEKRNHLDHLEEVSKMITGFTKTL